MIDLTPLLRAYAGYRKLRLDRIEAPTAQERVLLSLVRRAKDTRFGRDHGFADIRNVSDFQRRVPLRSYEDFRKDYWEQSFPHLENVTWPGKIGAFAITSGTRSGKTKYIPCSSEIMRSHMRAISEIFVHHLLNRPLSRAFAGRNLVLYGSRDLTELAPGISACDLTGLGALYVPRWLRFARFVPEDVELISDWEEKVERLARQIMRVDIRVIAGYPSWLLFFFARLAEAAGARGARLAELLPNLELVVVGGVHLAPYRRRFDEWIESSRAELRETYAASEGFVAVGDRNLDEGLRLLLDNGIFFEFVPAEEIDAARPTRHWIAEVEMGRDYAVVLTTCAGLWSYVLGDTVRFVEREPPRVIVSGRLGSWLNAFGEHVIEVELEEAVAAAATSIGSAVVDFTVFSALPERNGGPGRHRYLVELSPSTRSPADLARFADRVDRELQRLNGNYRLYRERDIVLAAPEVGAVPPDTFNSWMKRRGKMGGQNKVPRILDDPELRRDLLEFIGTR